MRKENLMFVFTVIKCLYYVFTIATKWFDENFTTQINVINFVMWLKSIRVKKINFLYIFSNKFRDEMQHDHETKDSQPSFVSSVLIISVAILWGATDACIKYFSPPSQSTASQSLVSYFLSLIRTPAYLLCLVLNQVGSVLYYYCLATAPLSVVR